MMMAEKEYVVDSRNPSVFGTVVRPGEEVSEIRWEDGSREYVNNDFIVKKKKKK